MEPEPQGAAFFYLEPEPTQFGRSRLRDLGRLEPPKKVAAPQHWATAQRKGGNPARNGRKGGPGLRGRVATLLGMEGRRARAQLRGRVATLLGPGI